MPWSSFGPDLTVLQVMQEGKELHMVIMATEYALYCPIFAHT